MIGERVDGHKGIYTLEKALGAGGFGKAWKATLTAVRPDTKWLVSQGPALGSPVVIKWPNLLPEYTADENARFLQDVNRTINSELSALTRLEDLPCVARIYDMGSLRVTAGAPQVAIFLVEEYLEGDRFDDHLVAAFGRPADGFSGIADSRIFLTYATQLASAVRDIHHRGVIHGDIWERNIVVAPSGELRIFDFGAAAIRDTAALRPDSLAARRSDSRVAPERRSGDRHGRRSDIYSLGGLFFFMAAGLQDPPQAEVDIDRLKSAVTDSIHARNPSLLASNAGIADIIARCLRPRKDERIRDADRLLTELRLFSDAETPKSPGVSRHPDCVACLLGADSAPDSLFARMIGTDVAVLRGKADDMRRGIVEVSGDHEELVLGMSTYLSVLGEGDHFLGRTTPRFWAPGNMGINGRFLSMLRLIAQRGVVVQQVMLVTNGDREDSVFRRILEVQAALERRTDSAPDRSLAFYCLPVTEDDRRRRIREMNWETCYEISRTEVKAVHPVFDASDCLRTLRIVCEEPETAKRRIDAMASDLEQAQSVRNWLQY